MKNIIPVVMAGVLGIYGLIIAVIIGNAVKVASAGSVKSLGYSDYSIYTGYAHLAAGMCCGYALAAHRAVKGGGGGEAVQRAASLACARPRSLRPRRRLTRRPARLLAVSAASPRASPSASSATRACVRSRSRARCTWAWCSSSSSPRHSGFTA